MKKLIFSFTALATVLAFSGVTAFANDTITTGLTRGAGGGSDPIVKAKWEMEGPCFDSNGIWQNCSSVPGGEAQDASPATGAQFNPPGVWGDTMDYTVCAIVTDPNGVADIDGVYADIYYPDGIAFHDQNPSTDLVNGGPTLNTNIPTHPDNHKLTNTKSPGYDYGQNGCEAFIEENTLIELSKADGIDLFCNYVKNSNNNLPTFFNNPAGGLYDYDEICGPTGELEKEEAKVFCDDKDLIWEDPAGDYLVEIFAQDNAGNFSYVNDTGDSFGSPNPEQNWFEYLPMTAFEVDFDSINYGQVLLNTHKRVSGDLTFSTADRPTVRNTGNTRLYMGVEQNDMGLGQTSGQWNVEYDARVGNEQLDWRYYSPEETQLLEDILDLSETEEMDFSILISKYPNTNTGFSGDMVLSAQAAKFRQCGA